MATGPDDVRFQGKTGSSRPPAKVTRLTQSSPHIGIAVDPEQETQTSMSKPLPESAFSSGRPLGKRYPRIGHRAIITSVPQSPSSSVITFDTGSTSTRLNVLSVHVEVMMTPFSRRRLLDIAGSITAASVLSALRPVRVAQAAEEKSTWNVKGLFMEACNCEAMCPCVVGNAPTPGYMWGPSRLPC